MTKRRYDFLGKTGQIDENQVYLLSDDVYVRETDISVSNVSGDIYIETPNVRRKLDVGPTRYGLYEARLQEGTVAVGGSPTQVLSCGAEDNGITTVRVSSDAKPVCVFLPRPDASGARDFLVRVECLSSSVPSIMFLGSDGESVDFESEDDGWATLEVGANLFNFTETKR